MSGDPGGGCMTCDCHPTASMPLTVCDSLTGQCQCKTGNSGVTGMSCDTCLEEYYNFNNFAGE